MEEEVRKHTMHLQVNFLLSLMQEKALTARIEGSSQREVFDLFLRRKAELVLEEERLTNVMRTECIANFNIRH